jgi:hypothetical protein
MSSECTSSQMAGEIMQMHLQILIAQCTVMHAFHQKPVPYSLPSPTIPKHHHQVDCLV